MCKESKTSLDDMAVFALSSAILLMCMGTGNMMDNAQLLEKAIEVAIFATPIRLDVKNFVAK